MFNSATGGSVGSLSIHVPNERPSHPSMILKGSSDVWSTAAMESWVDFGDGHKSLIDIDSIYPVERTSVPDMNRIAKQCLIHTINDFLD